ncbi:hypothetical protein [Christiangramia sp.]|uniref:hypothetical protein n=1 Tax=Christiangramia sp. TaxID=1931228 RepID=UPI002628901A|nr:hypothetical protein [Christiangramia sp.]
MEGYISITEFIQYLRENDLVITSRRTAKQDYLKDELLRKKHATIKEIADSGIWEVESKSGVRARLKNLKDNEYYQHPNGKTYVLISAVKREAGL